MIKKSAARGKQFVLTAEGYKHTPDRVKPERAVGKPIRGYERSVPQIWIDKGYVEEADLSWDEIAREYCPGCEVGLYNCIINAIDCERLRAILREV